MQRQNVCLRDINHVHVVPDAGSVGSGIIVSPDMHLGVLQSGLQQQRNEMRFRLMLFAEFALRIGSSRIEIT